MEYQPQLPWEEGPALGRVAPSRRPAPAGAKAARSGRVRAGAAAAEPAPGGSAGRRRAPRGSGGTVSGTAASKGGARGRTTRARGTTAERTPAPAYVVDDAWRLDDATRRAGRRGLAQARAVLARSVGRADARDGHAA